jgi:hypothetical protein
MAIVYIHRRKDIEDSFLNVFYIGIGRNESRAKTKKSRNFYWKNIVNKYGYDIEITHKDICYEEACSIEKYLISFYGREDLSKGKLVNMTDGGDGSINHHVSDELKQYLSKINIGKKHKEESKKLMSESRKGNKNHAFGKKMSEETKLKLSIAHIGKKYSAERIAQMKITFSGKNNPMYGKKMSEEAKAKMIKSLTGRKMSEEAKKNMSIARKGIKHTKEAKKNMSDAAKLSWIKRKNKINETITA